MALSEKIEIFFNDYPSSKKYEIQSWLANNPSADIIRVCQSQSANIILIYIWYTD